MSKTSPKKNYIYNLVYQIFSIIIPLITAPYISRVLGSSGVGQYSFSYSIASYFVLFGALGFVYYGQREIARFQGNKVEQTKLFWELIICRLFSVFVACAVYILLLVLNVYGKDYWLLILILIINVVSTLFDITFYFQGNEKFRTIVLRNIIVRIIGIISIFVFVKKPNDVWVYTLIQSLTLFISNISLFFRLKNMIVKVKLHDLNFARHFLPCLKLFVPTLAISVYTMLDKTLIGVLVKGVNQNGLNYCDIENGNYEQAEKIVKLSLTFLTSVGVVMLPRNSNAIAVGDFLQFKKNIYSAIRFILFLGFPLAFGIVAVSQNFAPWFFGPGYEKVPYLMMIFAPLVVFIGLSNVLGIQYLLPLKKDTKYTISILCGAVVNLILNVILIPFLWSFGACLASITAEFVVAFVMLIFSKNDVPIFKILKGSWKYFVSALVMFGIVFLTQYFLISSALNTIILVAEGVLIYSFCVFLLKDELFLSLFKRKELNKGD